MSTLIISFSNDDSVETGRLLCLFKTLPHSDDVEQEIVRILQDVAIYRATYSAAPQALTAIQLVQENGYTAFINYPGTLDRTDIYARVRFSGEPRGDGNTVEIFLDCQNNDDPDDSYEDRMTGDRFSNAIAYMANPALKPQQGSTPSEELLNEMYEIGNALGYAPAPDDQVREKMESIGDDIQGLASEWPYDTQRGFRGLACIKQQLIYLEDDLRRMTCIPHADGILALIGRVKKVMAKVA